jgi:hypothetical protein
LPFHSKRRNGLDMKNQLRGKAIGRLAIIAFALIALPAVLAQDRGIPRAQLGNTTSSLHKPAIHALLPNQRPQFAAETTALFAHVAVGGGFTTVFTFLNTGSTALDGILYLTDKDGMPLNVNLAAPSAGLEAGGVGNAFQTLGSSIPLAIPVGGTRFITTSALTSSDPTKRGWARVESTGGSLGGVATFQLFDSSGKLTTIAGVLAAAATNVGTIPLDDDRTQNRYTGFAVANPSATDALSIKGIAVSGDQGTPVSGLSFTLPLAPGKQTATFVFELMSNFPQQFRGSLVLIEQTGKPFSVVALVQNSGLYTAIPVIPSKAPGIN